MKICSKCKVSKDDSLFSKDKAKRDGLYPSCKKCNRGYYQKNTDKIRGDQKEWRIKNTDKMKEYQKIYHQQQFRNGMSWDNHGTVWHLDHIKPCASFDLTKESHQMKCFNYKNTQPLLVKENLEKHAKLNWTLAS